MEMGDSTSWLLLGLAAALLPAAFFAELRRPGTYPVMNYCGLAASAFLAGDALVSLVSGTWLASPLHGWPLLGLALVFAALAGLAARQPDGRNLASVCVLIALVTAGVAGFMLLAGGERAVVFALAAVLLGAFADRRREPRLQLGALGLLLVAVVDSLVAHAPPAQLLFESEHPARGVLAVAAAVVAAFGLARYAAFDAAYDGDVLDAQIAELQWRLRSWLSALAVLLGAYAFCLVGLEIAQAVVSGELTLLQREIAVAVAGLVLLVGFDVLRRLRRREPSLDEGRFEV